MYTIKSLLILTSMVASTLVSAIDSNGLFGLGEGMSIAGVVVRDINGVERIVDFNKAAHLFPRQDFCATETIYSCGAPPSASATPITGTTPGGPLSSVAASTSSAPTETTAAPAPSATESSAPTGGSAAPSESASTASVAGTTGATSAAGSTVVSATESVASQTSAASASAATTSALQTGNAGITVDANMAAAMVVGFAVAAFV